jgi:RND family efflux transporter MFP subunit
MPRLLLPALLALCLIPLGACSKKTSQATRTPTYVKLAPAFEGPALPALAATGLVMAKDELRLSFKVGGVIQQIDVQAGDRVRKGQSLARIEPTEIDAQLEQARQMADKANRDLARGERLQADEVIALEQLQNLRTQAAVAAAQLRSAQFNRGYASITAPRDGVILRRLAEGRELVPAGQPVLVLGAEDRGYIVRMGLSDRDVVQLARGDAVEVRVDALPDVVLKARVSEVGGAADERSGLFPVEARIETGEQRLVTGMVARLSLHPAKGSAGRLVYLPIGAVLDAEGGKAHVFVAEAGIARRREVQVAFISPDGVALRSGLNAGDQLVAVGAAYLDDGDPIKTP